MPNISVKYIEGMRLLLQFSSLILKINVADSFMVIYALFTLGFNPFPL